MKAKAIPASGRVSGLWGEPVKLSAIRTGCAETDSAWNGFANYSPTVIDHRAKKDATADEVEVRRKVG